MTENKLIMFYIILFGLSFFFYDLYSNTQIGSLFERSNYKEKYWVNLFPNENNDKNYRVPADIIATFYTSENECENNFGVNEPCEQSERLYLISKAYFNNGGYITFDDTEESESLKINEKVLITDVDGKEWWIELTDKKVIKPKLMMIHIESKAICKHLKINYIMGCPCFTLFNQNSLFYQIINISSCSIMRTSNHFCPFFCCEITFKIVHKSV